MFAKETQQGLIDLSEVWPRSEYDGIPKSKNYDIFRYQFPESLTSLSWIEAVKVGVRAALLGPSSHNMQARIYEIDLAEKRLRIIPDGKYIGKPSDLTGREAVIGIGTSAENIAQFMWAYGLTPEADIASHQVDGRQLAGIEFNLEKINEGELIDINRLRMMLIRRVYRGPFDRSKEVGKGFWQELKDLAQLEGIMTKVITDRPRKTGLALIQYAADNVVLQMIGFRQELGEFMGANDTKENRVMPGNTFGLSDKDSRLLREQLSQGGLLRGAFAAGFPSSDREAIISAHGIVVMVVKEDKPEYWIKAGMAMERVWLYAQSQGLGVGVMAGMVEVATKAQEMLGKLGISGHPAVVLRIGLPLLKEWPRSPRVSVDDVVIVE